MKVKVNWSSLTLCDPTNYTVHGILQASTLEWIAVPTQGLTQGLLHCRQILYHLSHQGSPGILEWIAFFFSSRSSWPRNQIGVSCFAGRFFTNWDTREAQECVRVLVSPHHCQQLSIYLFDYRHPAAAAAAKSLQSCPTLCDPIDGSPPGCPVPGILQARTLEWVAISVSNAWKWKVKVKTLSRVQL